MKNKRKQLLKRLSPKEIAALKIIVSSENGLWSGDIGKAVYAPDSDKCVHHWAGPGGRLLKRLNYHGLVRVTHIHCNNKDHGPTGASFKIWKATEKGKHLFSESKNK